MVSYADTGIIISSYLPYEGASDDARKIIEKTPRPVILSHLTLLEVRNALNGAISRREISKEDRDAIFTDIEDQMETGFFRMADVSQVEIYAKARELSDRHTPAFLTRSLDLMHVATALLVKACVFLSTDTWQRKAAKAEGLEVQPATLKFRE